MQSWTLAAQGGRPKATGVVLFVPYYKYPYDPNDGREDLDSEDHRVLRGGAFSNYDWLVRCAYRNWYDPDFWHDIVGFRVVVAPG